MRQSDFDSHIVIIADAAQQAIEQAQSLAQIKNDAKRHQERMAKYGDWVKPENIKARKEKHDAEAASALELAKEESRRAREALGIEEDPPLPDEKDLPPYMRGQAPSTIRAMLRHAKGGAIKRIDKPKLEIE